MKPNTKIQFMSKVGEDIIGLKFKPSMTLKQVEKSFYSLMQKHGIKRGTKTKNGVTQDSFEWTIAKTLFLDTVRAYFEFDRFLFQSDLMPNELEHY